MKVHSITPTGKQGSTTMSDVLLAGTPNMELVSQAVRVYRSNMRQGTSKVQTRSEVTRTKRKWYKQKGTGNARHGARSAHIFVGGGVAHGPTGAQNWSRTLSATMKRKALHSALQAQAQNLYVCEQLGKLTGKTKEAASLLGEVLDQNRKVLIITGQRSELIERACANIENALVIAAEYVNALDVAFANCIVLDATAEQKLLERTGLATQKATKPAKAAKPKATKPAKTTKPKTTKTTKTTAKKTT